jgi:branched-chain amino acid transport system substrate-binding protein
MSFNGGRMMRQGKSLIAKTAAVGLGGAIALSTGCDGSQKQDENGIAIGFMVFEEDVAQAQADTVRLLVSIRDINAQGGVRIDDVDYPLSLVTEDHGGTPSGGVSALERLAKQGVTAVIGPPWSSLTLGDSGDGSDGAIAAAKDLGILLISASATAPGISEVVDDDLMWRTVPSDAFQGSLAASLLYEEASIATTAILHRDDAWGAGLATAFEETYTTLGGTVTTRVPYDVSEGSLDSLVTKSWSSELDEIFEDSPEAIYLLNFDEFPAVAAAVVAGGYLDSYPDGRPLIFVSDSVSSENTLNNVPSQILSRLRGTAQIPDPGNENFSDYASRMAEEKLSAPHIYDAARHDAVFLIALAMQKANSTNAHDMKRELRSISSAEAGDTLVSYGQWEEARDALLSGEEINYDGPSGPIEFAPSGDPTTGTFVVWSISEADGEHHFEILDTVTFTDDSAP